LEQLMGKNSQGMKFPVDIIGIGVVTCVGLDTIQTASSVHAGISRVREIDWQGQDGNPFRGGFLPEDCLEEMNRRLRTVLSASLPARILQLAAPALRETVEEFDEAPEGFPIIVGVGSRDQLPENSSELLLSNLMRQAQVRLNLKASEVIVAGRTAGLSAMQRACARLADGYPGPVIAGGIDSYYNLRRLIDLDFAGRILNDVNLDGFLPGEGAGFLALAGSGKVQHSGQLRGRIAGIIEKKSSSKSDAQAPGDLLSGTIRGLMEQIPQALLPAHSVYSNLNGENAGAKEWGVCFLRNRNFFAEVMKLCHPAEYMGETGAAMGPILTALSVRGIYRGYESGPCLAWCSGDEGECAALYVTSPHFDQ
jgi:3-oxoacyl-[acyl-carrier-protein] synthase I